MSFPNQIRRTASGIAAMLLFLFLTALILFLFQLTLGTLRADRLYELVQAENLNFVRDVVFRVQLIVAVIISAWICWRLNARTRAVRDGQATFTIRPSLWGVGAGFAAVIVVVAAIYAIGGSSLTVNTLDLDLLWQGVLVLLMASLVAVSEETLCRGFILRSLNESFGKITAVIVTSVLFSALHAGNGIPQPLFYLNVALFGVCFALSVFHFGSLSWAIGFHAIWNWGESFVFGMANSGEKSAGSLMSVTVHGNDVFVGGVAGPEGSVFTTVMLLVAISYFLVAASTRRAVAGEMMRPA